jgi:endoglucanase
MRSLIGKLLVSFAALGPLACDPGSAKSHAADPGPLLAEPGWEPDGTPVAAFGQLQVADGYLLTEGGEPTRLKGVSSMWLNWETDGYAENFSALSFMQENWRISVVRAAMGVSPEGAYLSNPAQAEAQVRSVVEAAIELGLYVIIDWHDHDALEHQAEAEAFFELMASEYGEYPNVIYEPFNEPLAVNWATQLKPYHEAIVQKIRAVDPDNVIVLGTPNWCQDVDLAAGSPLQGDHLMYTLHFYACTHTNSLRYKADAARAQGLALFVTEWGATHADGGTDGIVCEPEADQWHDWMRRGLISWTAWKLDGCTDASCLLRQGAPVDGGWDDDWLQGHGPYVRQKLLDQ